jgi:16S rRNA (cytosine1402-N4)-methyltransferase
MVLKFKNAFTMHKPVLFQEVLEHLKPSSGRYYIDATVGAGGHTSGLLMASKPDGIVLAFDRDPEAISYAREQLKEFKERVILVNASYEDMGVVAAVHGISEVDGILMDLGLSSRQLDNRDRGFSFMGDGLLDMRYDSSSGITAAHLINTLSEEDMADIFWRYGEERRSRRYAKAIVRERPISSTSQLARVILIESGGRSRIHPATRIFQALRIAVNDELEILAKGLAAAVKLLKSGGRLAVISFHSLEDRIVKHFIREQSRDCICPPEYPVCICDTQPILRAVNRRVIRPSDVEVNSNPRSRSARMRVAEKIIGNES